MSRKLFTRGVAILLLLSVAAPAALFVAPQRAHAQAATGCLGGLIGLGAGALGSAATVAISVPVNSIAGNLINGDTAGSTWATCINEFVIEPLIRAAIRALIQKLTASVITWINGGNGTGQPSYVQNLPGHLQTVGDTQALAFLNQFGANSNSPFAAAITSSLAANYLQNTSSGGFFGANKDTLVNVTGSQANEVAFLNGNWSQGGVSAWFALTTQNQNNPYTLYQASQSQLGNLVTGAQSTRLNELSWAQGFLSWCGPANNAAGAPGGGTSPGNTCVNKDGTHGTTQTPGSIIAGYANQAVVSNGFQQLISANDIDSALNAIISALLNQVLGGVGGLFGASQNANNSAAGSLTTQLQNYSTANNTGTGAAGAAVTAAIQTSLTQTATYASSWQSIATSAGTAQTALNTLINVCTAAAAGSTDQNFVTNATNEAVQAQAAIVTEVAPVVAQADAAATAAATTQAMIQKVENESTTGIDTTADLQTLQSMPPTAADASNAVQNSQTTGAATGTGLVVAGGSIVDQMNLISSNAATLQASVCTAQ
jgi:hypothetical protein